MTQSKHTPGPWVLIDGDRFSKEKVITTTRRIEDSHGCICDMDVYFSGQMGAEQESNARLIAESPTMHGLLLKLQAVRSPRELHNLRCEVAEVFARIEGAN